MSYFEDEHTKIYGDEHLYTEELEEAQRLKKFRKKIEDIQEQKRLKEIFGDYDELYKKNRNKK